MMKNEDDPFGDMGKPMTLREMVDAGWYSKVLNPPKPQYILDIEAAYALNKRRDNLKKRVKSKKKRKLWYKTYLPCPTYFLR